MSIIEIQPQTHQPLPRSYGDFIQDAYQPPVDAIDVYEVGDDKVAEETEINHPVLSGIKPEFDRLATSLSRTGCDKWLAMVLRDADDTEHVTLEKCKVVLGIIQTSLREQIEKDGVSKEDRDLLIEGSGQVQHLSVYLTRQCRKGEATVREAAKDFLSLNENDDEMVRELQEIEEDSPAAEANLRIYQGKTKKEQPLLPLDPADLEDEAEADIRSFSVRESFRTHSVLSREGRQELIDNVIKSVVLEPVDTQEQDKKRMELDEQREKAEMFRALVAEAVIISGVDIKADRGLRRGKTVIDTFMGKLPKPELVTGRSRDYKSTADKAINNILGGELAI